MDGNMIPTINQKYYAYFESKGKREYGYIIRIIKARPYLKRGKSGAGNKAMSYLFQFERVIKGECLHLWNWIYPEENKDGFKLIRKCNR